MKCTLKDERNEFIRHDVYFKSKAGRIVSKNNPAIAMYVVVLSGVSSAGFGGGAADAMCSRDLGEVSDIDDSRVRCMPYRSSRAS
eukprot:m.11494 g.11494  ORF g.11494 m.11494 type:complete len:85 (-) comp4458_c0_seq1:1307-1561(-)